MSYVPGCCWFWQAMLHQDRDSSTNRTAWKDHGGTLEEMVLKLLGAEISPASMFDFEMQVAEEFREFARQLMELGAEIRSRRMIQKRCPTMWSIGRATGGRTRRRVTHAGHAVWNH